MSFSRIFFYLCLFFIFGVFLGSLFNPDFYFYFPIFVFSLIVIFVFYKKQASIFGICLLVFLFGVFWEEKYEKEIIPHCQKDYCDIHFFNDKGEVILEGVILEEPKQTTKTTKIVIKSERIVNKDKLVQGKVLVFLPSGYSFRYGDKIKIKGRLESPKNFTEEFNYKEYLRKERIYSVIYNPEVKLISSGNGNIFFRKIFSLKERLKETANVLPPPEGGILSAITLGDKSRLSQEFKDKLSRAGLSHIAVISGMHIMVLFEIFLFLLLSIGLWRSQATILTILFLIFYILMIGAVPSAVRAGIMGALLYLGLSMGRLSQSSRAIVFAASLMVGINPLILTRDVGFQLSFLSSMGIIYLLPIFERCFKVNDSKIKRLICLTLSAQIFSLPILIYNFGKMPILSVLSNLLVVPLLPSLLGLGFLFIILGTIFPFLALPLSFILYFPFAWVVLVVELISSLPFSTITLKVHWIFLLIFYLLLGYIIIRFTFSYKEEYEKET